MKNLRKLTKKQLKTIAGGEVCPPVVLMRCSQWCLWTVWQRANCNNGLVQANCTC
ncbi:MAG: bacteriocin-like protein [Chryseobacterium taeanense]